eukprot:3606713-Rhodomonas_salina.1
MGGRGGCWRDADSLSEEGRDGRGEEEERRRGGEEKEETREGGEEEGRGGRRRRRGVPEREREDFVFVSFSPSRLSPLVSPPSWRRLRSLLFSPLLHLSHSLPPPAFSRMYVLIWQCTVPAYPGTGISLSGQVVEEVDEIQT